MSVKLSTALECLSQSGGERLAEANNIGVVEETGRFGLSRPKGALYVLVEAAGTAKAETERQLVDILANEYERAAGSITASLRQAIAEANRTLHANNQRALPEMRMAAGVTCAVIRDTDVFLAQAGPALAYVLHQDAFQRTPVDSPWLSPDRAGSFPYMFPLGKRPEIDPELFHSPLQAGDTLLLSTVGMAHRIPQAQVKQIMSKGNATLIMRQLATLAGREDFSAVALELAEQTGEEETAIGGEFDSEEPVAAGGVLSRLRDYVGATAADLRGAVGRMLPTRSRADDEIEVPEMGPAPRVLPAEPTEDIPGLTSVPAQHPPADGWSGDPSGQYAQAGFLEDVVPPRGPRPLVHRPPLGSSYDSSAEPAPWDEEVALEEAEDEEAEEAPRIGLLTRLSGAVAGIGAGLRRGFADLAARLRRRPRPDGEVAIGTEHDLAVNAGEYGGDAAGATTDEQAALDALAGVPWRERASGTTLRPEATLEEDERAQDGRASTPHNRLGLPGAGSRLQLAAVSLLLVAAVAIGGLAFGRYREDQETNRRFTEFMVLAQEKRGLVSSTTDRATARVNLGQAQTAIQQALDLRPDDTNARALFDAIEASLDTVNLVTRISSVTTLVEVPETQSKLGRLVVHGIDLFFLDTGQNRVYKYLLATQGAPAVQRVDVNPVLVRKGDEVGNIVAGDLVDIVWMPAGGLRTTEQLMALESGGNLMGYDSSTGMRSLIVRDSSSWRKPNAISSFQGNFYLLDTQLSRILKYDPTARGYENAPQEWLKSTVDLTNAVDLAIDGDVYVLNLDGKIQRFRGGSPLSYTQPDLDRPMMSPASLFTQPGTQSLYVVDAGNKRILQLGKDGGLQRQYLYGGKDGAFDALRSVYVDEAQGRMYLTSGKKLLAAILSK